MQTTSLPLRTYMVIYANAASFGPPSCDLCDAVTGVGSHRIGRSLSLAEEETWEGESFQGRCIQIQENLCKSDTFHPCNYVH